MPYIMRWLAPYLNARHPCGSILGCGGCDFLQEPVESALAFNAAVVVELVDTPGLGPGARKGVGVQVPPTAPGFAHM